MSVRRFRVQDVTYAVTTGEDGTVRIGRVGAPDHAVRVHRLDATTFEVVDPEGSWRHVVHVVGTEIDRYWAFGDGHVFDLQSADRPADRPARAVADDSASRLSAPMPASVLGVSVVPGQTVRRGDVVVLLEAMKMELPVRAPSDGVVTSVSCKPGELVQPGRPLVELTPADRSPEDPV